MASEKPSASEWNEVLAKQWAQVVARAWSDAAFKKRLLAQPAAALKEAGLEAPEGFQVKVVENTDRLAHLVLPPAPGELAEEELERVAGGCCVCIPVPCVILAKR